MNDSPEDETIPEGLSPEGLCGTYNCSLSKHGITPKCKMYMKSNPLKKGEVMINSAGIGTVTRKMVRKRAAELARLAGRSAREVSKSDLATARRELTGEAELDPKQAALEAAPESERWDPVPGSQGRKVPVSPGEDEDDEGRSDNERLVEEGVEEAELDQMDQATRPAATKGKAKH